VTFANFSQARSERSAAATWQKFSKVSLLLDLFCKITIELTFEKFLQARAEKSAAAATSGKAFLFFKSQLAIYTAPIELTFEKFSHYVPRRT